MKQVVNLLMKREIKKISIHRKMKFNIHIIRITLGYTIHT